MKGKCHKLQIVIKINYKYIKKLKNGFHKQFSKIKNKLNLRYENNYERS